MCSTGWSKAEILTLSTAPRGVYFSGKKTIFYVAVVEVVYCLKVLSGKLSTGDEQEPGWMNGRVILVNMVISVILGHEKTKIQNMLDLGKIDVFFVRTNIYIKKK